MKSLRISQVFFLLSVAELKVRAFASEFSCEARNLTVTVDDILRLYIDGIKIPVTDLPNANIWRDPDVVDLPCTTRLIAIHGKNADVGGEAGIMASTNDDYVLTNSNWKCSNFSHFGWEGIDFDDSAWMPAVDYGRRAGIHDISPYATWIWHENMDAVAYCRKKLDINECLLVAPDNECDPSMGKCIDFFGGYNCSCYEGYTNNGSKRCKAVSTGNDSTSVTILGVFFGISVFANLIALVLHFRKITVNDEGQRDVNNQDYQVHQNDDNVLDDELINVAEYEYPDLRDFAQQIN